MLDVTFDCRQDAGGKDPDSNSPTLRRYHQILWSKPLPCGNLFDLDISGPGPFLVHRSDLGEFYLTSDSITHRYAGRTKIRPIVERLPEAQRRFATSAAWVVSECTVFPGKVVDRKATINGARGMHPRIGDRFDLTLECIRRHYSRERSPLSEVLDRNASFFALFKDFQGYVDFFLLQDLVSEDYEAVRFYLPFDNFAGSPIPCDFDSYVSYLQRVEAFARGRANRMVTWCEEKFGPY